MSFSVHNGTDTTSVTTSVDVQPDGIVHLNDGVGITDGAAIRGVQIWDILGTSFNFTDSAQFVLSLLVCNPVNGVATLDVINKTEVFSGFLDLDDIHETSGESG